MNAVNAKRYRLLVARAKYVGVDRADVQFSAREAFRRTSRPRVWDWAKLRRLAWYLLHVLELAVEHRFGEALEGGFSCSPAAVVGRAGRREGRRQVESFR